MEFGQIIVLERFSIECRETNAKAIQWPITTNVNNTMNQWELETNTRDRRQAQENACDQVAIGFGFASDWLRGWREFVKPITKRIPDYVRHSIENCIYHSSPGVVVWVSVAMKRTVVLVKVRIRLRW